MVDNNEIKVKSLQKALEILNLFTVKPVLGVTEISEYFGIYKSTVHNILSTLKAMEYLEQDEETGKYRLGIQVFTLLPLQRHFCIWTVSFICQSVKR